MTATRIVTHCLAVWNSYTDQLVQEDKDFFDEHVHQYEETDEFVAALELVKARLERDGLSSHQALERSRQLMIPYTQAWGVELPPMLRAE